MNALNLSQKLAARSRAGCFLVVFMLAGLLANSAPAQTLMNLHNFTGNDGSGTPNTGLILSGNALYGTTEGFEEVVSFLFNYITSYGTLFAVHTDGTSFTNLYTFPPGNGVFPNTGLVLSGNTLYGTTSGDVLYRPELFSANTDGTGTMGLHAFSEGTANGSLPNAMILSGNTLYGTSPFNDSGAGNGALFAINTNGTGYMTLYNFTTLNNNTNSDGAYPGGGLVQGQVTLYGTASGGGNSGDGTVFAYNLISKSFTTLHDFTGSDGASPNGGLTYSHSTLNGMTRSGGTNGNGTVFSISTKSFRSLYSFTALSGPVNIFGYGTNSDGASPQGGLVLSGNTLYGTAAGGGKNGNGTVFAVNTDGTGFRNVYSFSAVSTKSSGVYTNSDGAFPNTGLILSGNTLYGTTSAGGNSGNGTVFSLALPPPQLTITPSGANVILTWPTNAAGFTLQVTANLAPPVVWNTNSTVPVVISGQNFVTNPIAGTQMFFRLMQ